MAVYQKNGTYWIDTYVKGKRVRRKIGPDRKTAELVEKDLKVKVAREEYLGIVEERKVYFEDFAQEYLKWSKANKSPTTYAYDVNVLQAHLIPFFKGKYLAGITAKHLEDYKTLRASLVKPRTVNRELDALKSLFSRAVEWGYIKEHPGEGVKKLKFQQRPPTYLTTEQIEHLLAECGDTYLYAFVVLGAYTGMRKGELLRLKWSDIDFRRGEITVRQAKNNEFRVISMDQKVVEVLRQHPRHLHSDLVLARPDGEAYRDLRDSFESALRRGGLERIRIHDLRHSFASNLVSAGASLAVVRELMGHRDIKTTMIYAHLAPNLKQAAVDLLVQNGQYLDTGSVQAKEKSRTFSLPDSG